MHLIGIIAGLLLLVIGALVFAGGLAHAIVRMREERS